jgi:UDP-N-acetylmuramoyl-tripeptide--D-alanyl-D-alanine ligase
MEKLLLSEICKMVNGKISKTFEDRFITNINTDTRTLEPGDLFLALAGENYDAQNFVDIAVEKGVAAIIATKENVDISVPTIIVEDTQQALIDLATCYRERFNFPVVAVTGSAGKTSTKEMLTCILAGKFKTFSTEKNYNNHIGLPKSILELNSEHQVAVFEMGMNHTGEIDLLTRIAKPTIAIITNVGKAHIEHLETMENIFDAKMEVVNGLEKDGILILNGDDEYLRKASGLGLSQVIIFVGTKDKEHCYLFAENINSDDEGISFDIIFNREKTEVKIPIIGIHNVSNALLTMACALKLGMDIKEIALSLKDCVPSAMRCEVELVGGVKIIKDYYNANPEAMVAAISMLAQSNSKKIAILGEMFELGKHASDEHRKIGKMCKESKVDFTFFVGASSEAFKEGLGEQGIVVSDKSELFKEMDKYIQAGGIKEGDTVLIKGSRGMKMEEVFEYLKERLA